MCIESLIASLRWLYSCCYCSDRHPERYLKQVEVHSFSSHGEKRIQGVHARREWHIYGRPRKCGQMSLVSIQVRNASRSAEYQSSLRCQRVYPHFHQYLSWKCEIPQTWSQMVWTLAEQPEQQLISLWVLDRSKNRRFSFLWYIVSAVNYICIISRMHVWD